MREHDAIFANFINRYGDFVLLDYAEEIVIPAFRRKRLVRKYGKTNYRFYKVRLVNLSKDNKAPVLALIGRFIKDTELTRVQRYDVRDGLIRDERSLSSAPSAFFVLFLNNHRLIYYAETPHAPPLRTFQLTALHFMRLEWKDRINVLYGSQGGESLLTKKKLRQLHPIPTLEVIPLADRANLAQFVKRYDTLKRIDFRLVRPNDELDAAETLDRVRQMGLGLNATNTKVSASNVKGLDLDASIKAVTEATENGNQEISLTGTDADGNRLSGNNESFELSVPVIHPPKRPLTLARRLVKEYQKLVDSGAINAPSFNSGVSKILSLMERL